MTSSVKLHLNDYPGYCSPGQVVSGFAECNFNTEKKVRAIRLRFKGRAHTRWTKQRGGGKSTRRVVYESREAYFDETSDLLKGKLQERSGDAYHISSGRHIYPFSYLLPQRLPSSLEHRYGNIRYYVGVVVDRPWKRDYKNKILLNVVAPLDLNSSQQLREPVKLCSEKGRDRSGAITFTISLPVTGFVPGQDVTIVAHIHNMSNKNVESVIFKLMRKREFIAKRTSNHKKYDDEVIAQCSESGVGAHGEKTWTSGLHIPNRYFENVTSCNIINDRYILKAKAVLPTLNSNIKHYVDIVIGTIPLEGIKITASTASPAALGEASAARPRSPPPPYTFEPGVSDHFSTSSLKTSLPSAPYHEKQAATCSSSTDSDLSSDSDSSNESESQVRQLEKSDKLIKGE